MPLLYEQVAKRIANIIDNTEILPWLKEKVDSNVMNGLEKALYMNAGEKLKEFLRKYMMTCISYPDVAMESSIWFWNQGTV